MLKLAPAVLTVLLCATPAFADLSGRVARVHDGDTLTLDGSKVRLWGIDAPELKQKCGGTACGVVARDALQALVQGKVVTCAQKDRDRYQRVVASCQVGGADLGEAMVRSGNALDYPRYSRGRYRQAERDAEIRRAGMWAGRFVPPWEWRRKG
jgi:endonuclease YncB( thermonuclease family)